MAASNPEIILRRLNEQLNSPLELTVIGRAALILGYDPPILDENAGQTFDVDLVIPRDQEEALDRNDAFWSALERINDLLSTADLYLSHIFLENQIILGENWKDRRDTNRVSWRRQSYPVSSVQPGSTVKQDGSPGRPDRSCRHPSID
jgi:hypothetical protein